MNLSIPPQRDVIQVAASKSSLHQVACPALLLSRAALLIGGLIFTACATTAAPSDAVGGEKTDPPWVTAGQPAHSRALQRMSSREPKEQMPPLATHRVDEEAVALLKRWIEELPAGKPVNK